ncbi:hypothetical protein M9H77_11810 [Catharanthus roseus]|uniref:Uncharacterized protein n=1 Tax=Catharanthus roseus TaxID=4058 RepID=A0ACC0BFK0_CATRO|nr:hypothetical protein M9H77_11810 [Catharanthus roseus]
MVDYNDLKKKVSDLTLCIEKFTKGKGNFEKLLCSQRSSFDKSGIGYNHTNTSYKQTRFVKTSSSLSHLCCTYCEKNAKNANIGRGENFEEGGSSRGRGKGKRVPSRVRAPDILISLKEATNFEKWTRNRRKIDPGHRVDLNDTQVGDHIRPGKIYNQHTFKRMGFERNEERLLVSGGQNKSDGDDEKDGDDEEQEEMNVDEETRLIRFYTEIKGLILETGCLIFFFTVKNITVTQTVTTIFFPSYIYRALDQR